MWVGAEVKAGGVERTVLGLNGRSRFAAERIIEVTGERPVFQMANSPFRPEAGVRSG